LPLLAEIPLDPATREGGDTGKPISAVGAGSAQAKRFEELAQTVVKLAAESSAQKLKKSPTITIAD